jgi:hypothetical protein
MLTPILLSRSAFGAYFLFGFLAIFAVIFLGFFMPETRGKSLESIQDAFSQPIVSNWTSQLKKLAIKMGLGNGISSQNEVEMENFPDEAASTASSRSGVHRVRPVLA